MRSASTSVRGVPQARLRRVALACLACLACLAGSACSDTISPLSSEVSTRDLRMTMIVEGSPLRTRVFGTLTFPASTFQLIEGDRLEIVVGDQVKRVTLSEGTFAGDFPSYGGPLVARLARPAGRGGDLEAVADLPAPFRVRAPKAARLASSVTFTWDAGVTKPTPTTKLSVTGTCVASIARELTTDTGRYSLNPGELEVAGRTPPCTVTVSVSKERGPAKQSDTTTFELVQ